LCLGSAKPIACDGPEGRPRHGGRERDNETAEEDGLTPVACRLSLVDLVRLEAWAGAGRASAFGYARHG
jgi:hypothetical protein